jgi:hypothetical protein
LPFGETPSLPNDLSDRLIERPVPLPLQVADERTIAYSLESRKTRGKTLPKQSSDFVSPARFHHPGHTACDSIV